MKKILEYMIISGFVLFFLGGFLLVAGQLVGLVLFNQAIVVSAREWFRWIFPLTGITGLLCWVYSYIKGTSEEE